MFKLMRKKKKRSDTADRKIKNTLNSDDDLLKTLTFLFFFRHQEMNATVFVEWKCKAINKTKCSIQYKLSVTD